MEPRYVPVSYVPPTSGFIPHNYSHETLPVRYPQPEHNPAHVGYVPQGQCKQVEYSPAEGYEQQPGQYATGGHPMAQGYPSPDEYVPEYIPLVGPITEQPTDSDPLPAGELKWVSLLLDLR